jgi:hypothetical protein
LRGQSSPGGTRTSAARSLGWLGFRAHGSGPHRNVQRFRGGLVIRAYTLCVSLNSRLASNEEEDEGIRPSPAPVSFSHSACCKICSHVVERAIIARRYTNVSRTLHGTRPRVDLGICCILGDTGLSVGDSSIFTSCVSPLHLAGTRPMVTVILQRLGTCKGGGRRESRIEGLGFRAQGPGPRRPRLLLICWLLTF